MFIAAFFACVATTLPDGRADVLILFFNGVLDRFIFGDRVADMVLLGSWKMCLPLPGSFFLAGLRSRDEGCVCFLLFFYLGRLITSETLTLQANKPKRSFHTGISYGLGPGASAQKEAPQL